MPRAIYTTDTPKTLRDRLDTFVHHPLTEVIISILIIVSVVLTLVEVTQGDQTLPIYDAIHFIGDLLTSIFCIELFIRWYVARRKWRFFQQYWLDIIAVFPWMRSLRVLRVLRLLRIFRMGLLINRRLANVSAAFRTGGGEYFLLGLLTVIVSILGAVGLRSTEGTTVTAPTTFQTLDGALWWSVMSLVAGEPVGAEPQTHAGRFFALLIMLSGLVLFAIFTGTVSAVMTNRLRNLHIRDMYIDELRQHTVICGWNRSGFRLMRELSHDRELINRGVVIVAEFQQEPDLDDLSIPPEMLFFVRGDYTQLETLKRCNIPDASTAILLVDRTLERSDQDMDARTVLAAIAIERMNPEIFTSVELMNRDNGSFLQLMGVEEIVVADEYAGHMIAMSTRHRGMIPMIDELLTSNMGNDFFKLPIPPYLQNTSIKILARLLHEEFAATLIALETVNASNKRYEIRVNPPIETITQPNDQLIVIASSPPNLLRKKNQKSILRKLASLSSSK